MHGGYLRGAILLPAKKVDDAVKYLEDQGFDVIITDSLYNDLPLNTVRSSCPDTRHDHARLTGLLFSCVGP